MYMYTVRTIIVPRAGMAVAVVAENKNLIKLFQR